MTSLEDTIATRRHIILLTDGWSSSGQYDAIIARMKAAGITLSTVGAGGGSNPFLEGLAKDGGGRFYDAANPASIPDIFLKETQQVSGQQIVEETFHPIHHLVVADPARPRPGLAPAARLQRDDGQARRPDRARHRPRRPAPRPVAVRAGAVGRVDVRLDRPLGHGAGSAGTGSRSSSASSSAGRSRARRPAASRRRSMTDGDDDQAAGRERRGGRLAARLLHDRRRDRRRPTSTSTAVGLVQVAPGVYEAPLGEIDAGRLRRPRLPDAAGLDAARADARPRRADAGRVPAARRRTSRSSRRSGRRPAAGRSRRPPSPWTPRPDRHRPVHRPVADAC